MIEQIWRVEHREDHQGPYWLKDLSISGYATAAHPGIYSDNPQEPLPSPRGAHHLFGFASCEALKRWFDPSERVILQHEGFIAAQYEVDCARCIVHADHQLIFDVRHAKLLQTEELL